MRLIESPRARTAFLVLALFTLLAGDAWRYSVSWIGFGVVVALLFAVSVLLLVRQRARWRWDGLPYPLLAFLVLAALSVAWSFYPGFTALGVVASAVTVLAAVAVAVTYGWAEILRGLGLALRFILGLSLVFEFVVAAFVRHPVLPLIPQPGVDYSTLEKIPKLLYWSRDELFDALHGGKIQGIVGNSSLLSFVALLAIIVFSLQLADSTVTKRWGIPWLAVAVATLVLSRSATTTVGLIAVIVVVAAVLIIRRTRTPRARGIAYGSIIAIVLGAAALAIVFWRTVLALLGKSEDLTNRTQIWSAVIDLAQQRPVQGWGWVGYWVPWAAPFDTLASNNGVRQLHAHNAWLDIWLQLGIIGLVVFGALVLSTLARSWNRAVDRPQSAPNAPGAYSAVTILPLAIVVALVVQSLAESRLLVEYGLFLLALMAIKTKTDHQVPGSR